MILTIWMLTSCFSHALLQQQVAGPTATAPASQPAMPEHLAHPEGYKAVPNVSYISLRIPKAIDRLEWALYSDLLQLSEAQREALETSYDRYRRADWDLRVRVTQPLWDESTRVHARFPNQITFDSVREKSALFRRADATIPSVVAIENTFMFEISQLLTEGQLALLETMRLHRERSRAKETGSPFPAFHYDLEAQLFALKAGGMDVTPSNSEVFNNLMQSWRSAATSLHNRLHDETMELVYEGNLVRAELMLIDPVEHPRRRSELEEEFHNYTRKMTKTARRILDLNQQYVRMIADLLPAETANQLNRDFCRTTYRSFYPDTCDLADVFEAVRKCGLNDVQAAAVDAYHADWKAVVEPVMQRMLQEYLEWREQMCIFSGYRQADHSTYARRMSAMLDNRIDKSKATVESVLGVLNDQQRAQVAPVVEGWRVQMLEFRAKRIATENRFKGWPGPSD